MIIPHATPNNQFKSDPNSTLSKAFRIDAAPQVGATKLPRERSRKPALPNDGHNLAFATRPIVRGLIFLTIPPFYVNIPIAAYLNNELEMDLNIPSDYENLINDAVASGSFASPKDAVKHVLALFAVEQSPKNRPAA